MLEAILARLGIDTAKGGLKAAFCATKAEVSERQYKKLLSTALCELLKEHPDIYAAQAGILAAEATDVPPSPELLRTKEALEAVSATSTLPTCSVAIGAMLSSMNSRIGDYRSLQPPPTGSGILTASDRVRNGGLAVFLKRLKDWSHASKHDLGFDDRWK